MLENPFLWINTRDGSPTLWNNEISEPFRTIKGAFSESWLVFAKPGLDFTQEQGFSTHQVGEFGLGPGTNWLLTSLGAALRNIPLHYFAIEKDSRSFAMGLQQWFSMSDQLSVFFNQQGFQTTPEQILSLLNTLPAPIICESLSDALAKGFTCHVWYHDPFGFDVNPDGYSDDTLNKCHQLWSSPTIGLSYACNKHFKAALLALPNVNYATRETNQSGLTKQRMEFKKI